MARAGAGGERLRTADRAGGRARSFRLTPMPDALPLAGLRVLDLTRARAGPTAVRQLADWGADALMIEPPVALDMSDNMSGPRHGPDYQNLHRNKRSMTLNLKAPEGI